MQTFHSEAAPAAVGPYVQAIGASEWVYVSGQLGLTAAGELATEDTVQLQQALVNVQHILAAAELALTDVVKVTLYVTDMQRFAALNEVYAEVFGAHKPARSAVEVAALPKGAAVEVDVIACRGTR